MLLDNLNKIVINLPERTDRLERFKQESIFSDYIVMPGIKDKPASKGIGKTHIKCVQLAKDNKWPYVLIMEDDLVYPAKEKTLPYIEKAFKEIPNNWDIILGGVYNLRAEVYVNKYWRRVGEFCALHWYIVNEKAYDTFMKWDDTWHIDRWIGNQGLNIYLPHKFWAIQEDGYSDNVEKITDYNSTILPNFKVLK